MPTHLRRYALLIALLTLFAALAFYYSLALPLGEATDETHHFALVQFIAAEGRPPLTPAERQAIGPKGDASPLYHGLLAALIRPITAEPPPLMLVAAGAPERFIPFDRRLPTQFLHTADEQPPYRGVVLAWHIARLPSILLGAATLALIYLTALAIFPGRTGLALAATAFAAFLPRFVTSSAVVNDDNLIFPLIALALLLLVRLAQGDDRPRTFWLLGVVAGLAAIAKYHALLLLPEIGLVLLGLAWRQRWPWSRLLRRGGAVLLAFALTAGWYFGWLLWRFSEVAQRGWLAGLLAPLGDPVTTGAASGGTDVGGLGWLEWLSLLFRSFWLEYGGMQIFAPAPLYWLLVGLSLLAAGGLLLHLRRRPHADALAPPRLAVAVLLLHLTLYGGVVLLRYLSLPLIETAQGRHLYPALSAIAILFVWGLRGWLPTRHPAADYGLLAGLGGLLLALSLVAPRWVILPEIPTLPIHTRPPAAPALNAELAPGVTLLDAALPATARPGQSLPLTLTWQAGDKQERDAVMQLCWRNEAGLAVACTYRHPLDGRYPLRAWEAGFTVPDEFALPAPGCLPPGPYEVTLTLRPLRRDRPITAFDDSLPPLSLGVVSLTESATPAAPGLAVWLGDGAAAPADVTVSQLRQSLAVVATLPAEVEIGPAAVQLVPAGESGLFGGEWLPVAVNRSLCTDPAFQVVTASFLADASVRPGAYQLYLSNQPQPTQVTVQTTPRTFTPPAQVGTPANLSFSGEVELLGYQADLSPRRPGEVIELTAHWQAQNWMARNYVTILKLLDNNFGGWGQVESPLGQGRPAVLRAPGEVFTDRYRLAIAPDAPAGLYTLEFSLLYDIIAEQFFFIPVQPPDQPTPVEHLYFGPVRVLDPARDRAPQQPLAVTLADQIELLGYDLAVEPRQSVKLALHWQAVQPPAADYTVFVQLLDAAGQVVAQQDNPPQAGRYPTTAWALQDRVVDRYNLSLPADAPPGQYRLLAGMYNPATGQRLPALANGAPLPDNAIEVTVITVE